MNANKKQGRKSNQTIGLVPAGQVKISDTRYKKGKIPRRQGCMSLWNLLLAPPIHSGTTASDPHDSTKF
eukprot:72137-Pelagomonas_calceolata.AAC.3